MILKKITCICMAAVFAIGLCSCGGGSGSSETKTTTSETVVDRTDSSFTSMADSSSASEKPDVESLKIQPKISVGYYTTVGLKSDGTVLSTGTELYNYDKSKPCIDISVYGGNYFALYSDQTLKRHYPPYNKMVNDDKIANVEGNGFFSLIDKQVKKIVCCIDCTFMLFNDGTVYSEMFKDKSALSEWKDIVNIGASCSKLVAGVRSNGTVLIYGDDYLIESNKIDVSNWTDIIDIAVGVNYIVGLKSDGTVIATGSNTYKQLEVGDWKDIKSIAVSDNPDGACHTLGLKADGTVVAAGNNFDGQCNVSGWKDIIQICAGRFYSVGLKSDGTVVATGDNKLGQCNVSDWKLL